MKNILLTYLLVSSACLFIGCGEDDDPVAGCMDNAACNYNSDATEDDGSCQVPSENELELVDFDETVTGLVNEELVAHIEIRNSSCMDIAISASQALVSGGGQGWGETKFCLGTPEEGLCYAYGVNESDPDDAFPVASFEEGDYFQGYLKANNPGEYVMRYTITSCCAAELAVDVTFIIE